MLAVDDKPNLSFASYSVCPFPIPTIDHWFRTLRKQVPWSQPVQGGHRLPRMTAWFTRPKCTCHYQYSNVQVQHTPFSDVMHQITRSVAAQCGIDPNDLPNSCNVNLYKNGKHSLGWHSDDEPLFGEPTDHVLIISLSLGDARTFAIKKAGTQRESELWLGHGDLCTMEAAFQQHYRHAVPKSNDPCGERINLTWRWVTKHVGACPELDTPSVPIRSSAKGELSAHGHSTAR